MLRALGGPEGFTAFMRGMGDATTRLDRWETALNEAVPGDVRDTTTPRAMLVNLQKLAFDDVLKASSREQLIAWLKGSKTGGGEHGTMNDVGIIWPPDGTPILLAIYLTNTEKSVSVRAAIYQEVGRLVAAAARA